MSYTKNQVLRSMKAAVKKNEGGPQGNLPLLITLLESDNTTVAYFDRASVRKHLKELKEDTELGIGDL